ncbi:MAG: FAD-dependent oxidoreductase [Chloroflexi bacterium]|nr:FAD-dependent oxidoreductase [Chloroflexota bacterium]
MARVVVIGAGVAGLGAALTAAQTGVETILLERNDFLSGLCIWSGLHGGGPVLEEMRLVSSGSIRWHDSLKRYALFWEHDLPSAQDNLGDREESFAYDVMKADQASWEALEGTGVKAMLRSQVVDVEKEGNRLKAVVLANGTRVEADAFVDATGRAGLMKEWCETLGQGCGMCVLKCPLFGECISPAVKAGAADIYPEGHHQSGGPRFFQAVMVLPESVEPWLRDEMLAAKGVYWYRVPEEWLGKDVTSQWCSPHRPLPLPNGFVEEHFLINYTPWLKVHLNVPLHILRQLPGFRDAFPVTPLSPDGQTTFLKRITPNDNGLRVEGLANLFAAGERARTVSSMTPAMALGDLAGYNAARCAVGLEPIVLPDDTILGLFINVVKLNPGGGYNAFIPYKPDPNIRRPEHPAYRQRGLVTGDMSRDIALARERIERLGLVGLYQQRLV